MRYINSNKLPRKKELKEKWAKNAKYAIHKIFNKNEKIFNLISNQINSN